MKKLLSKLTLAVVIVLSSLTALVGCGRVETTTPITYEVYERDSLKVYQSQYENMYAIELVWGNGVETDYVDSYTITEDDVNYYVDAIRTIVITTDDVSVYEYHWSLAKADYAQVESESFVRIVEEIEE